MIAWLCYYGVHGDFNSIDRAIIFEMLNPKMSNLIFFLFRMPMIYHKALISREMRLTLQKQECLLCWKYEAKDFFVIQGMSHNLCDIFTYIYEIKYRFRWTHHDGYSWKCIMKASVLNNKLYKWKYFLLEKRTQ